MLVDGELDAVLHPDIIKPLREKDPRVGRLFPNYKADEAAYFKKTGIYPIMHVIGIKQEIVDKYPWVPVNLYQALNEFEGHRHGADGKPAHRADRLVSRGLGGAGRDLPIRSVGIRLTERNRHNLETLVGYSFEQGLIKRKIPLDELFLAVSQGRRRGEEFTF